MLFKFNRLLVVVVDVNIFFVRVLRTDSFVVERCSWKRQRSALVVVDESVSLNLFAAAAHLLLLRDPAVAEGEVMSCSKNRLILHYTQSNARSSNALLLRSSWATAFFFLSLQSLKNQNTRTRHHIMNTRRSFLASVP